MAKLERTYTIPLRKGFVKVPKYLRAKRATNQIKAFIEKHMKTDDVKIGKNLNEFVWQNGIKNPPGKVKVNVVMDDGTAKVELEGYEYKVAKVQTQKEEAPKGMAGKLASITKDANADAKDQKTKSEKSEIAPKKETKIKDNVTEKKTSEPKKEEAKPSKN